MICVSPQEDISGSTRFFIVSPKRIHPFSHDTIHSTNDEATKDILEENYSDFSDDSIVSLRASILIWSGIKMTLKLGLIFLLLGKIPLSS